MNDTPESTPSSETDWLSELSDAAVSTPVEEEPILFLPALDRERPVRPPVVPKSVWVGALIVVAVLIAAFGIVAFVLSQGEVEVPNVVGLEEGTARTTLTRVGLELVVTERRFSSSPENEVLEQTPGSGASARRGDTVEVIVSAGTEEFVMPDVTGQGLSLARGTLEGKGLFVEVDFVVSDAPSDTVLSSIPAAGATVRTGDAVRLQVASPRDESAQLQPYRLDGLSFIVDPAPPVAGLSNDPTLEVARRLKSLLDASGASTRLLRSSGDTGTGDPERAARAAQSTATAAVGLSLSTTGEEGLAVSAATSLTAPTGSPSTVLASAIETRLAGSIGPVRRLDKPTDPVFGVGIVPWTRITLGAATSRTDVASFVDPVWADSVARAIYQAIGQVYGSKETP